MRPTHEPRRPLAAAAIALSSSGPPVGQLALLRAYEPVLPYTHGGLFLPTAVGPYLQRCSLWIHQPSGAHRGNAV